MVVDLEWLTSYRKRFPFKCPVCDEIPLGEVQMCNDGDCVCLGCFQQLPEFADTGSAKCPVCQEFLPPYNRCRAQEARIALLPATCKHCALVTTRGEITDHEPSCSHRPAVCSAIGMGCSWGGRGCISLHQSAHEAACPYVVSQRMVWPLQLQCAELKTRVQELEDTRASALARVVALEADARERQAEIAMLRELQGYGAIQAPEPMCLRPRKNMRYTS